MKKRKCLPNLNLGDKWKNIKKQIVLGLQHVKRQLMPWESQIKLELHNHHESYNKWHGHLYLDLFSANFSIIPM